MNTEELFQNICEDISCEKMVQSVKSIGTWHRYTGTIQGEHCVDYILQELYKMGIPAHTEEYPALVSLPLEAYFDLETGERLVLIGDVYSRAVTDLPCCLIYDVWSEQKNLSEKDNAERFEAFKDRLVVTRSTGGDFAEKLSRAGAVGMLHISATRGGYIHHNNIGAQWGTPSAAAENSLVSVPAAGISFEDGQMLIKKLSEEMVTGKLTIKMDTQVRVSRMPVLDIPGKSEKFVLINGHYDSWYEGITDNATSDAILLELARVFWKHREKLKRSVRIAWWSGHSDARYAGSTWYCDHHLKELRENCVADINLDLTGCRDAEQVRARTTCMEGERFTSKIIREYTGYEAKPYIPMIRGADQSFWGARIPISIMLKYEPLDEKRVSPCPSGGPWWHTDQDTLDKLDERILLRDTKMNAKLACMVLNAPFLPVELTGFVKIMGEFLDKIEKDLNDDFSLKDIRLALERFEFCATRLEENISHTINPDEIIKRIAGELTRLVYTSGSSYQHDRSIPYAPFGVLKNACGMTHENTPDAKYLFQMTEFKRACNRMEGQLDELTGIIRGLPNIIY